MKISRINLLAALKLVSPALSNNKNQLEELSHFWFDGTHLSAYDDLIGIKIEFPTEFKGGIVGDKLIGILENSRARDVTITEEDKGLLVKVGKANITFALRPIEDWFWKPARSASAVSVKITTKFLTAIDLLLLSVGNGKILSPEQRGITVIPNGNSVDLYSTDAVSISWMNVDEHLPFGRSIFPTPFCEQVKKNVSVGFDLVVDENAVYCSGKIQITEDTPESYYLLFSRLVEDDDPQNFKEKVAEYLSEERGFDIPTRLKLCLDRAAVLIADGDPAEFTVEEPNLFIYAQTQQGEIDDVLAVEGTHPSITVNVDPRLLKRGIEDRKTLFIRKDCVIMNGPENFYHLIATK